MTEQPPFEERQLQREQQRRAKRKYDCKAERKRHRNKILRCKHCDKGPMRSDNLKRHISTYHPRTKKQKKKWEEKQIIKKKNQKMCGYTRARFEARMKMKLRISRHYRPLVTRLVAARAIAKFTLKFVLVKHRKGMLLKKSHLAEMDNSQAFPNGTKIISLAFCEIPGEKRQLTANLRECSEGAQV